MEKPQGDGGWINGGFFVLLPDDRRPHRERRARSGNASRWRLAPEGNCQAFFHDGFWQPMDTLPRDKLRLEAALGSRGGHHGRVWVREQSGRSSFSSVFSGRRVLVTGHTGFKGSWLALWLQMAGAEGHRGRPGTTNDPEPVRAGVDRRRHDVDHHRHSRCAGYPARVHGGSSPTIVFHLAAQPLVGPRTMIRPTTFATNVLGTVNVLEAVRSSPSVRGRHVTSDKCYENREWLRLPRDRPAGRARPLQREQRPPPKSWRVIAARSFAAPGATWPALRAGNVIGGGDWAADRHRAGLRPRAEGRRADSVRNPGSFVRGSTCSSRWPDTCAWPRCSCRRTATLMRRGGISGRSQRRLCPCHRWSSWCTRVGGGGSGLVARGGPARPRGRTAPPGHHEGRFAARMAPIVGCAESVALTADWYLAEHQEGVAFAARDAVSRQIEHYEDLAAVAGVGWTTRDERVGMEA